MSPLRILALSSLALLAAGCSSTQTGDDIKSIKAAVSWALGVGAEISWRCFVAQASITRVATAGGRPSLHSFNDISHLIDID